MISKVFGNYENVLVLTKLVLTMPALFIVFSGMFIGALVNKFGRIKVLNVSLFLYATAGSSGYWADNLYTILVGRAFLGVAVGGITTVISTLSGDYFHGEERHQFSSTQGVFMALGGVVFVGLGGFLADINWRMPFAIYLFSLVVLLLSVRSLYEPKAETGEHHLKINKSKIPVRNIAGIFLVMMIGMLLFYLIPVQLPFLLNDLGYRSASLSGIAIAISTAGGAIGSFAYASLKKRLHYRQLFTIAFLFIAVGFIVIGASGSYALILAGLLVSGFGVGFFMPNGTLWLLEITPLAKRSVVMGLFTTTVYLGQFLSPLIVQPVVNAFSLTTSFQLFGALAVVLALLQFVIFKSEKRF
jgi:Arabinose efflux permease